jgi:phospholipase C
VNTKALYISILCCTIAVTLVGCGAGTSNAGGSSTPTSGDSSGTSSGSSGSTSSPPTVSMSASPASINSGQSSNLSWSTSNAVSASIDNGIGPVSIGNGSRTVSPTSTTTYTITAVGANSQQVTAQATVTVHPAPSLSSSVKHIIVLVQENRSFDHYFGFLNDYRASQGLPRNVDDLPANAENLGFDGHTMISAFHLATECTEEQSPFWNESHVDYNREDPRSNTARMDGFAWTAGGYAHSQGLSDTLGRRAMGYYTAADLPYYYFMATQFATSDRWFSPVDTRTQPNRMYLIGATSQGFVYPPAHSLSATPIFKELDDAGVSWKIYSKDGGTYLSYFQPYFSHHHSNVVPASQFLTDANNGTLPAVAYIEGGAESGDDEHPPEPVQVGEITVAGAINGLIESQSWKDSAFILTWDEGGGFYDHVPPVSTVNPDGIDPIDLKPNDVHAPDHFTRTGFRVPLIVISPFAKKGYVSHTVADYTAILKFIERRWDLPPLNRRDAAQPDMTEFFDWSAPNINPPTAPTPRENLRCTPEQMQ